MSNSLSDEDHVSMGNGMEVEREILCGPLLRWVKSTGMHVPLSSLN